MTKNLVESVTTGNLVQANDAFKQKMNERLDFYLSEHKKIVAAKLTVLDEERTRDTYDIKDGQISDPEQKARFDVLKSYKKNAPMWRR